MRLVTLLLLLGSAVLLACSGDATGSNDPCQRLDGNGALADIRFSVSSDSSPVIDWNPPHCGASYLEVYRVGGFGCVVDASNASPSAGSSCGQHYRTMWRIGTGTLPLSAHLGPPTIMPPVTFGQAPASAGVDVPPDTTLTIGDTLLLFLARPEADGSVTATPPYASVTFIVGVGVLGP